MIIVDQQAPMDAPDVPVYMFVKGEVLRDTINGIDYRVLYVEEDADTAYWIKLDGKSNIPIQVSLQQLRIQQHVNALLPIADIYKPVLDDNSLSEASLAVRDQIYNVIKVIVTKEPGIYDRNERVRLLKEIEDTTNIRYKKLYRFLGLYWRGGMVPDALAPQFSNRGGHRTSESTTTQRLGRPKREGANGKILTAKDYEIFATAVKTYREGKKRSIQGTYKDMIDFLYCVQNADGTYSTLPGDEKPSFGQFRYWYRQNRDIVLEKMNSEDENTFDRNHRELLGNSTFSVLGPGMAVQTDATIGDIYLVSVNDPMKVVGRPVIFMTMDVYSRMIVGLHVCLENASHKMARLAMANTMNAKVEFCRQFGIDITESDWPCHFKPVQVVADNGELGVEGAVELVSSLGITIVNCPPYRGDLKAIVERLFGWIQLDYQPYTPGYVAKDEGTRGTKDHRREACLDIRSFTQILIELILLHNNYTYLDSYQRSPDQYDAGIRAVPRDLWNYGMEHCTGSLQKVPLSQYCHLLYTSSTATVTEHGIRCNGVFYANSTFREMHWFEKARISGHFPVQVFYDEMSVNKIFVKVGDEFISCPIVESFQVFQDKTPEEMVAFREDDLTKKAAFTQESEAYRTNAMHRIDAIRKTCESRRCTETEMKRNLSSSSIAKNREEECAILKGFEKARQRQQEMGLGGILEDDADDTLIDDSDIADGFVEAAKWDPIEQSIDDALRAAGLID